jgi:hypothetical protein
MKRSLVTAGVVLMLVGGAQAREVAFCDAGFDITKVSGDKAVCQKVVREWVSKGSRSCIAGGHIVNGDEASDGGDKCTGNGIGSLVSGPAVLCEIDPRYGAGYRTRLVRDGRDECQRQEEKTSYGDIKTRVE